MLRAGRLAKAQKSAQIPACARLRHDFSGRGNLDAKLEPQIADQPQIDDPLHLHILLRFSGRSRHDPPDALPTPAAGAVSLLRSIAALPADTRRRTRMTVLLNGGAAQRRVRQWFVRALAPLELRAADVEAVASGNKPSFEAQLRALAAAHRGALHGTARDDPLVFFVEEDYLFASSAIGAMVQFFEAYDPCMATPYDPPEQYFPASGANRIKFGSEYSHNVVLMGPSGRPWRSSTVTAVTYAARLSFLVHLTTRWTPPPWPRGVAAPPKAGNRSSFVRAAWRALPNPVNDFAISRAISREFGVWAPLPGLATHVHLDLAPDVRSPAFPFDAVYNETRAGARRLAALLAV